MPSLTGEELDRLAAAIGNAFDADELDELVRITFGEGLYQSYVGRDLTDKVLIRILLEVLEHRGDTVIFLRAVRRARPHSQDLIDLIQNLSPIAEAAENRHDEERRKLEEEWRRSRLEEEVKATKEVQRQERLEQKRQPSPAIRADPPEQAPRIVKNEYMVWYGTNRRRYDASDLTKGYSAKRDSKVHYGSCRVYIPEAHKIGSLGSRWWKRVITRSDDRLKLRKIKETDSTSFWHQIAFRLSRLSVAERHAVIFVHGYNVSFHDAALRAAQIGFDLSVKGTMAFFSWPSQGSLGGYMADSATIEASEQDITDFMTDFVTHSGAEAVHVIAHSMGNRGVLRAVNRIAQQAQQRSGVPFGQVILAAADVDSDNFSSALRCIRASRTSNDAIRLGARPRRRGIPLAPPVPESWAHASCMRGEWN
jgi:pimeloyl-ACP methyl ester carboxylesterase